jgi:hypothetical protein
VILQSRQTISAFMSSIISADIQIQNFVSKLKDHLLSRIQSSLRQAAEFLPPEARQQHTPCTEVCGVDSNTSTFVHFKDDRLYLHKLLRFHFTTYDVRRGTDIINAGTSRCHIVLLADDEDAVGTSLPHHFLYARVLGAFHVNVIYTGPGMHDYNARRFDFLWVRWFELLDPASSGWEHCKLDSVCFPPMNRLDSFGFVNPKDVLRGCHILPAFSKGKRHTSGVGISRIAKDGGDYKHYYVGRYVKAMRA